MLVLERETRLQRRLRDLELRRRGLGRREPVLELVPGLRERLRDRRLRVPLHPGEDLGRGGERADRGGEPRRALVALRRAVREHASDGVRQEQRPDEMAAAALVLLLAHLAVLVASRSRRARRRGTRRDPSRRRVIAAGASETSPREQLLGRRPELVRAAHDADDDGARDHAAEDRGPLEGQPRPGTRRLTSGSSANSSTIRAGPRRNGVSTSAAAEALAVGGTSSVPSGMRTAQAHAVGPCTSTPFGSAIPPSLIFSSATGKTSRGRAC